MLAYAGGDRAAFVALFERWAPRIAATFMRSGMGRADADDLVQQTFLQLHRARLDFRPGAPLRPWLYTIALNLERQLLRRRRRKPESALADDASEPAAPGHDPDAGFVAQQVRAVVMALPDAQREVIMLHLFEGMSFREVGEVLGATQTAVKVRAHRAYGRLRELLERAGVTAADLPAYQETER